MVPPMSTTSTCSAMSAITGAEVDAENSVEFASPKREERDGQTR
jgi:hypothetical protein